MQDGNSMVRIFRKSIKNYIRLFFMCLCIVSTVSMPNNEEFFLQGNKYFEEKDYEKAFVAYSMIDKKGAAVLYNMGNCLFHLDDYVQALVYWLRAEKYASGEQYNNILRNKGLAFLKLGKQKKQCWWQQNTNFIVTQLPFFSYLFLQLLFLLCWWIFLWELHRKKKRLASILFSVLGLCMIIVLTVYNRSYGEKENKGGLVVKKDAHIFAGPHKDFQIISSVEYADYVCIKEARIGWYKIEYDCTIGWVEENVIQVI